MVTGRDGVPQGVLFRGAAEGHIRKYLIEDRNYLDAVIGLPANIFYGISIPTCVLVYPGLIRIPLASFNEAPLKN